MANSSGSVTNQAIQVLQGPYIQSAVGNGVQCQGPTLNLSPFVTRSFSWQVPYESYYNEPVYDNSDLNDDGILDNPGGILYNKRIRTGQKDTNNWNFGFSATISIPLDGGIQERCKSAMSTQTLIQKQILANKQLDYTLARLKTCGELSQKGIRFKPNSNFAAVCSDVIAATPVVSSAPHTHEITITPGDLGLPDRSDFLPVEQGSVPELKDE